MQGAVCYLARLPAYLLGSKYPIDCDLPSHLGGRGRGGDADLQSACIAESSTGLRAGTRMLWVCGGRGMPRRERHGVPDAPAVCARLRGRGGHAIQALVCTGAPKL